MNTRTTLILVIIAAVLGGIWIFMKAGSDRGEAPGQDGALLGEIPLQKVKQLELQSADKSVTLQRGDKEEWKITDLNNYPADDRKVRAYLVALMEMEGVQPVTAGPSKFDRLGLLKPWDKKDGEETNGAQQYATYLALKDSAGEKIADVLLGDLQLSEDQQNQTSIGPSMGNAVGRYIAVGDNLEEPWLTDKTLEVTSADPLDWARPDFLAITNAKAVAVDHPDGKENDWKASTTEDNPEFNLDPPVGGKQLKATTNTQLRVALNKTRPTFTEVYPVDSEEATAWMTDPVTATVLTDDDLRYTLKIGSKDGDEKSERDELFNNVALSIEVEGQFSTEREPAEDEKPEEKEVADRKFDAELNNKKDKLEKAEKLEGWVYILPKSEVNTLLLTRDEAIEDIPPLEETDASASGMNRIPGGAGAMPGMPGGAGAMPGADTEREPLPVDIELPAVAENGDINQG